MQRTMRLKLNVDDNQRQLLLRTMEAYTEAFNIVASWGHMNRSHNKLDAHIATYHVVRSEHPELPSSLVQAARDCACEALKGLREIGMNDLPKRSPHSALRYNQRVVSVFLESGYATLSTVSGRVRGTLSVPDYFRRYDGWVVKSSNLVYDRGSKQFYLSITIETNVTPEPTKEFGVLGIDRGINNVAVTSVNQFFSSKEINRVRGRYQHLRRELQSKGTRSAKRKLKELSGRERRFRADVNHRITKEIASMPFGVLVLEDLNGIREGCEEKAKGPPRRRRRKNAKLGSWSFFQFEQQLRYKAEALGKTIVLVDPAFTSQRCPKCGCVSGSNRYGAVFHCIDCGFELHADLVAARNIARLGISEAGRLFVNQPNVATDDLRARNMEQGQLQAPSLEVG